MEDQMQGMQAQEGVLGFVGNDASSGFQPISAEDSFAEPPVTDMGGDYVDPAMLAPMDNVYVPPAMSAPIDSYQAPQMNYDGMGGMDAMNFTATTPDPMSFTAATPEPMSFTAATPDPMSFTAATPDSMSFTAATPDPMSFTAATPDPMSFMAAQQDPMSFNAATPAPAVAASPTASPPGYVDPFQGMPVSDTGMGAGTRTIPEMNALREWENSHERELEEIDSKEKAEKKEKISAAKEELVKWYEDLNANKEKRHSMNRMNESTAEAARAEAMEPGANPWKLVAELIDTNARTSDESRDTSRMRALLIQLKTSPVLAN